MLELEKGTSLCQLRSYILCGVGNLVWERLVDVVDSYHDGEVETPFIESISGVSKLRVIKVQIEERLSVKAPSAVIVNFDTDRIKEYGS